MCAEMDLFSVMKLEAPQRVTVGVRPLRSGETLILQATAGRVVDLVIPETDSSPVAAPPVQLRMAMGRVWGGAAIPIPKPDYKNHPQTRPNPHWGSYRGAPLGRDAPPNPPHSPLGSYRVVFFERDAPSYLCCSPFILIFTLLTI